MISSFDDVVAMLMKHGATEAQAKQIMIDVYVQSDRKPHKDYARARERSYQMAKWAIAKAKEHGEQNARLGHVGNVVG
jgi:hypothetical protein